MLGKWDKWYKNVKQRSSFRYGNSGTYQIAAEFLEGLEVEDWGCGTGAFKKFHKGKYTGIDGSWNPFVDKIADLRTYRSNVDGIMMRHVLEHNYDWKQVLENATASFNKRFCLILFTPFTSATKEIAHNKKHGVDVPDIAFSEEDIDQFFLGLKKTKITLGTKTAYNIETVYLAEK